MYLQLSAGALIDNHLQHVPGQIRAKCLQIDHPESVRQMVNCIEDHLGLGPAGGPQGANPRLELPVGKSMRRTSDLKRWRTKLCCWIARGYGR